MTELPVIINLVSVPIPTGVKISWNVTATGYLDGYLVIIRDHATGSVIKRVRIEDPGKRECTITDLDPTREYVSNVRTIIENGGKQTAPFKPLPAVVLPPPPPPPPPVEPEVPKFRRYLGLHAGNWMPGAVSDIGGMSVKVVRLPSGMLASEAPIYKAAGYEVIGIFGESGSLSSIAQNAVSFALEVLYACEKYDLLAAEIINEYGGNWFWSDAGNIPAMLTICKTVFEAWQRKPVRAKLLVGFDGGKGGGEGISLGEKAAAAGLFKYCHGQTCHPYGGGSGNNGGALGDRHKCLRSIEVTGMPLWVTEGGWPTGTTGTGDSQPWTEPQQAANYAGWITFFEATPKFECNIFYGYKNSKDSGGDQYGVEMHDSSRHKPAFAVLGEACKALANAHTSEHQTPLAAAMHMLDLQLPSGPIVAGTEEHGWMPGEKLTPQELVERDHASMLGIA